MHECSRFRVYIASFYVRDLGRIPRSYVLEELALGNAPSAHDGGLAGQFMDTARHHSQGHEGPIRPCRRQESGGDSAEGRETIEIVSSVRALTLIKLLIQWKKPATGETVQARDVMSMH